MWKSDFTQDVWQLFHLHLMEHPLDVENADLDSVLDLLHTAYTEVQTNDPEPIKQAFRRLDECMKDVSLDTNNEVFSIVCQIYCAGGERAFLDGVRIGAHLVKELSQHKKRSPCFPITASEGIKGLLFLKA